MEKENESKSKTSFDLLKYCPICKGSLFSRDSADIFVLLLHCSSDHQFHVPQKRVLTNDTGRKYRKLSFDSNDKTLTIKKWLSDPTYRSHLNDQMAEILRLLLESNETAYNKPAQKERGILYCPFCGEEVKRQRLLDNLDIYSQELKCVKGHNFTYRNCLMVHEGNEHLELCQDMDFDFLIKCANDFVEKKELRKYIPDQVIDLVTYLMEKEKVEKGSA